MLLNNIYIYLIFTNIQTHLISYIQINKSSNLNSFSSFSLHHTATTFLVYILLLSHLYILLIYILHIITYIISTRYQIIMLSITTIL